MRSFILLSCALMTLAFSSSAEVGPVDAGYAKVMAYLGKGGDPQTARQIRKALTENRFGDKLSISNKLRQSAKGNPYWEILYPDPKKGIFYDYVSIENDVMSTSGSDYYIEDENSVVVNDKRAWMFDLSIVEKQEFDDTKEFPAEKYLYFKNPNYVNDGKNTVPDANGNSPVLNLRSTLAKVTTLAMNQAGGAYKETQVDRTSIFVYYPNTTLYLLVDTNTQKIYVMQTTSNRTQSGDEIYQTNYVYLKQKLSLPAGWMFAVAALKSNTPLLLISNADHRARVIQDDFSDSYQYVRPEEAPFLYEALVQP